MALWPREVALMSTVASAALKTLSALRLEAGASRDIDDPVIVEMPIAISFNGRVHAVMMATPTDLEDFALGYALGARIIEHSAELQIIEVLERAQGMVIELLIPQARFDAMPDRSRDLPGTSACGLCGTEALAAAWMDPARLSDRLRVQPQTISAAVAALSARQPLNRMSGGVHAAGFAELDRFTVREDIGRHNALDKLIGAIQRARLGEGFVVMSSRASYELVHKAATAGIELLATVSAPSTAAISLAERVGLTLIAFARGESMNIYTHPQRLVNDPR